MVAFWAAIQVWMMANILPFVVAHWSLVVSIIAAIISLMAPQFVVRVIALLVVVALAALWGAENKITF